MSVPVHKERGDTVGKMSPVGIEALPYALSHQLQDIHGYLQK